VLLVLLAIYVSSYTILSRRGFALSDRWDMEGFYFLLPENTDEWRFWNDALVRFYYPLILIDNWLGTGRPIASEPLWGLSRRTVQDRVATPVTRPHTTVSGLGGST
jgi:hypothetical protein